jgi:phosphohistidine phosphatase
MVNLMLMRHGKSDWDTDATDDHSRPLNARGKQSADRMGHVLRELGIMPDLVVASTATRARSTAELARLSGGWASRLVLENELYGADVAQTLEVAARYGDASARILLVGHQPTWSMVVSHLTGARVEMRTATVADIEVHTDGWTEVPHSRGALVALLQPRHFLASAL